MNSLIAVVDYGMGNLRSVAKALEHVTADCEVVITSKPEQIAAADRVVFPGQGAARDCMLHLQERDLIEPVRQAATEKPFLGICMGLQVLMNHSDENGGVDCMGLYAGDVKFFGDHIESSRHDLKIPHMGWNNVEQTVEHPLWQGIEQHSRFYFVHSYFVRPEDDSIISGKADYGIPFVTSIACENVFAVQFHPEKSAADGLQLLSNFVKWDGEC
jgi:glutamine amidotransferase